MIYWSRSAPQETTTSIDTPPLQRFPSPLVSHRPFDIHRCGAKIFQWQGCPRALLERLTPLQLAAKLGNKKMFKHILRKRTRQEWKWGPVSEHKIPLDEIDSAYSKGRVTVMELLVHPHATKEVCTRARLCATSALVAHPLRDSTHPPTHTSAHEPSPRRASSCSMTS